MNDPKEAPAVERLALLITEIGEAGDQETAHYLWELAAGREPGYEIPDQKRLGLAVGLDLGAKVLDQEGDPAGARWYRDLADRIIPPPTEAQQSAPWN